MKNNYEREKEYVSNARLPRFANSPRKTWEHESKRKGILDEKEFTWIENWNKTMV